MSKRLIGLVPAALMIFALVPSVAFADNEGITPYTDEPAPGSVDKMPSGLGLDVASSNSAPAVGDTVTYFLSPTGTPPSGNSRLLKYKYRCGVMQWVDDSRQFVVDPLNQSVQENNIFEFTFPSSNEYRLDFYLIMSQPRR